jgi:predicted amidohydrolase
MMSEVARSLQITLVGGSIAERSGNNLYNACCVFGSDGQLKGKHRKVPFKLLVAEIQFSVLIDRSDS